MDNKQEIPFTQEILRKGIHLISLSIPVIYIFVTRELALLVLIPLAILFIILDLLSKKETPVRYLVFKLFGKMLRPHETDDKLVFNGATWVLLSACFMVLVFPKVLTVTSFSILIISDISAAIFGRRYGMHRLFTKSWEGTLAFIISAIVVVFVYGVIFNAPVFFFIAGIIASVISGFVEAASAVMKIDDNFSIPVSFGIIMWIGSVVAAFFSQGYLYLI